MMVKREKGATAEEQFEVCMQAFDQLSKHLVMMSEDDVKDFIIGEVQALDGIP